MENQIATKAQSAPVRKVDALKNMLNMPSVKEQFEKALGKNANAFAVSVLDLWNGDKNLQECESSALVKEALTSATMNLPLNKALGFSYIVAYKNNIKQADGSWKKVMTPTWQIGYKGLIQLAMRTGQYRTLNADVVYEGELQMVSKLTGEINLDGERKSDKVVGYFCYFELNNGFAKTLYMSVADMARHAKQFSKGIKAEITTENLASLANTTNVDTKSVGWVGNFNGMAIKTVIRLLLSKYGYLSIEMQEALDRDIQGDEKEINSDGTIKETFQEVEYEDVSKDAPKAEVEASKGIETSKKESLKEKESPKAEEAKEPDYGY